MSSHVLVEKFV